mmetsp:Transcript_37377/g.58395  ORF Transcript_37377/g.58395 Transcript_37377/m.58395 type:complete len:259 (-) Transcript_37377:1576-2352(-)
MIAFAILASNFLRLDISGICFLVCASWSKMTSCLSKTASSRSRSDWRCCTAVSIASLVDTALVTLGAGGRAPVRIGRARRGMKDPTSASDPLVSSATGASEGIGDRPFRGPPGGRALLLNCPLKLPSDCGMPIRTWSGVGMCPRASFLPGTFVRSCPGGAATPATVGPMVMDVASFAFSCAAFASASRCHLALVWGSTSRVMKILLKKMVAGSMISAAKIPATIFCTKVVPSAPANRALTNIFPIIMQNSTVNRRGLV